MVSYLIITELPLVALEGISVVDGCGMPGTVGWSITNANISINNKAIKFFGNWCIAKEFVNNCQARWLLKIE